MDTDGEVPICSFALRAMAQGLASRVVVVISPSKEAVRRALGNGSAFGVELTYVVQDEPRGLPHAIACARKALGDNDVVFAMPDTVFRPHDALMHVERCREEEGVDVALGVFPTREPTQLAPVQFDGRGRVRALYDKPPATTLRNTWGALAWSSRFSDLCCEHERQRSSGGEGNLTEVMERARRLGWRLGARMFSDGAFCDAGTPAGLAAARELWIEVERELV